MSLRRHLAWVLVGLAVLFVLAVRVRLRDMPLERDEGEYAYMGQLMLHGVPPYSEACNMKLPGTYAAYALIMAVFGQSPSGIHLGVALVNAASIILLFLLGRKLLDEVAGVVAAVVFALMSLSPYVLGLAGHATHFVVLPALGGILLLARPSSGRASVPASPRPPGSSYQLSTINYQLVFTSGLLFGLAFLMKQHGVFFGIFGALYLIGTRIEQWFEARQERKGLGHGLTRMNADRGRNREAPVPQPSTLNPQPAAPARLSHFAAAKRKAEVQPQISQMSRIPENPHTESPSVPSVSSVPSVVSGSPSSLPPPAPPAQNSEASEFKVQGSKFKVQSSPPNPAARSLTDPLPVHPPSVPSVSSVPSVVSGSPAPRSVPQSSALVTGHWLLVTQLALFAAGLALPYLLTCLLLWWAGVFHEFVFWTISYASKYASSVSLVNGPDLLKAGLRTVVGPNIVFWLLPWIGALVMWWDERLVSSEFKVQGSKFKVQRSPSPLNPRLSAIPSARLFLTLFLFCSFASVSVGLYFREHYFITLLPVLALLTGVAVSRALHVLRHERTLELFLALPALILMVVGLGAALLGNASFWFGSSPAQVVRNSYSTTLFSETMNVAACIKTNTTKEARIAVIGSEPEIYFYSRRRSATGCLYVYPLMETHPFALKMQEDMISQIERARPEYVVYVADPLSWLRQPNSKPRLDEWWRTYWPANLDLVMTVPVEASAAPEQLPWVQNRKEDKEEGKGQPQSQLLVFKRKAGR